MNRQVYSLFCVCRMSVDHVQEVDLTDVAGRQEIVVVRGTETAAAVVPITVTDVTARRVARAAGAATRAAPVVATVIANAPAVVPAVATVTIPSSRQPTTMPRIRLKKTTAKHPSHRSQTTGRTAATNGKAVPSPAVDREMLPRVHLPKRLVAAASRRTKTTERGCHS